LAAVREALGHSWKGYEELAWLFDEVIPISGGYRTTNGGWGASVVDSLDTLWIMSTQAEFEQLPLNVFETTIRYLGGFLNKLRGAMDLTNIEHRIARGTMSRKSTLALCSWSVIMQWRTNFS
jgi:mannosyl-oligosaccharide alpha-1,2-mannosidase